MILTCVLLLALVSSSFGQDCYQCASISLKQNWLLTGLPTYPIEKAAFFNENCMTPAVAGSTVAEVACQSGCITVVLPTGTDEPYQYVRGCHSDFLITKTDAVVVATAAAATCRAYKQENTEAYAFSLTCPYSFAKCNGLAEKDVRLACTTISPSIDCNQCIDEQGSGECSTGRLNMTAKGPVCASLKGTLDGRPYTELGVGWSIQSVSDTAEDNKCFIVSSSAGSENKGALYSAPKAFVGSLCYCKTAGCNVDNGTYYQDNGATGRMPILFTLVPVLFALPLLSLQ